MALKGDDLPVGVRVGDGEGDGALAGAEFDDAGVLAGVDEVGGQQEGVESKAIAVEVLPDDEFAVEESVFAEVGVGGHGARLG